MTLPRITQDIMATNVMSCSETDTLATAHKLMREHQIRHMPVVDSQTGEFLGLVTQKEVLRQAFTIAGTRGIAALESAEAAIPVTDVMSVDAETVQPQLPLLEDGKLVGIITSADFVKLSVKLLQLTGQQGG